ncbi:hypothetical protein H4219_004944 [Mycoemilia scoparia]|uniref:Origin recognition complex subunit 5 n=1 Tax=Mycoemilia scoparia TaxID=417184 RepID=A0A9W7ZY21_9FUNG|nr:hypothetical protein H4219_004944 [Mycoemilia scoparia]
MEDELREELNTKLIGRDEQVDTLLSLFGEPNDITPPSVFMYGPSASGKTYLIKEFIKAYDNQYPVEILPPGHNSNSATTTNGGKIRPSWFSYIDCVECNSPRLIFERAINSWVGWRPSVHNGFTTLVRCESSVEFVNKAGPILNQASSSSSSDMDLGLVQDEEYDTDLIDQSSPPRNPLAKGTRYMIFDHAERLRDLGPLFLSSLLRLNEFTSTHQNNNSDTYICVVMITQVPWDKFRPRHGGAIDPLMVRFTDYSKQNILDILGTNDCPKGEPLDFFLTFVDAVYEVFHRNSVNLNELRHLVALLYPRYVEPVYEGQATRNETSRLFRLCQPYFVSATDKLFLREISSSEWQRNSLRASAKNDPSQVAMSVSNMVVAGSGGGIELPYYTKFLLISAFLASYNPARMDVAYFAKTKGEGGGASRRRGGGGKKAASKDKSGALARQQLLGPKSFPVERMLAIFYSILDSPVDCTIDIYTQIASLVTLKLLVRITSMDKLESMKCRCNVGYDFVRIVAKSVLFDIDRYLYDFV